MGNVLVLEPTHPGTVRPFPKLLTPAGEVSGSVHTRIALQTIIQRWITALVDICIAMETEPCDASTLLVCTYVLRMCTLVTLYDIPYRGKFSWDKISVDFMVGLTSAKIKSAN